MLVDEGLGAGEPAVRLAQLRRALQRHARWQASLSMHAFDVSPDRKASIAAAGQREDGRWHVEVFERQRGTAWIPGRLAELADAHDPRMIVCDGKSAPRPHCCKRSTRPASR